MASCKRLDSLTHIVSAANNYQFRTFQLGTLWYLGIFFRNITIFSSVTKYGMSFAPRMEMPVPKKWQQ